LARNVLTIHSRGTAIVPMSVPLTQALGTTNRGVHMDTHIAKPDRSRQILFAAGALLILFFLIRTSSTETFDVRSVTANEAKQLIDSGAVVVDVRGREQFDGRHIPGAISVPLSALRAAIPTSLAHAIAEPVVVYCGDGVTIGPEGTALLNKAGYARAVNLQSGIQGWADAGFPVQKQASPGA